MFEIPAGTDTVTTLVNFIGTNGENPYGHLTIDSSGDLFGTTYQSLASNGTGTQGTVFEIAAGTHTFTTLAVLGSGNADPRGGLLLDSSGDLFGTSTGGGAGYGSVFEIVAGTNSATTLAVFNVGTGGIFPYGNSPTGSLVQDASGDLFGAASGGGTDSDGTIFEIAAGSHALSALVTFSGTNGNRPTGDLVEDASGNIYGTTQYGGTANDGMVFEIAAGTHAFTTLVSFTGANGSQPLSGLTLDAAGNLFGTTSAGGTDGDGTAFVLTAGSHTLTTLFNFTGVTGDLPEGTLFENSSGMLFGTSNTGGAFNIGSAFELPANTFTITATDALRATASQTYTIPIAELGIVTTSLPGGTLNQGYSQTIAVSGGTAPITFAVTSGSLPQGLTLNTATGAITGTPSTTTNSPFSFTITATDATNTTASQAYTLAITSTGPVITTTTLPSWTVGHAYSQTVGTSNGASPITLAVSSGALPTGLSLNTTTGAITGTPTTTTGSPFTFTITATDANDVTSSRVYTVAINAVPALTATLPNWTVGQAYSQTVSASGGTSPITFTLSAGALPSGLSLNSATGAIIGTPNTITGSPFSFTIQATDATGTTVSQAYSVAIDPVPAITTITLPNWTVGQAYGQTLTITGGTSPVTFTVSAGALPTGLSLNSGTGAITGTPTTTTGSPFSFTILATDAAGAAVTHVYSVAIDPVPAITTTTLPNWTEDQAYNQTVTTTGGTSPFTFTVSAGALPTGLSLNTATGAITGTPTTTTGSPFSFTIQATDAAGTTTSQAFSVAIANQIVISTPSLPNWTVGQVYSQSITTTDMSPIVFGVSAGALPAGLSLNSTTGAITGTPTIANSFSFTITATDAELATGSQAYAVTIAPVPTITTATLPNWTVGLPYSQTVTTTGGTSPFTFSVSAGALPAGLSLNTSSGAITGTPSTVIGSPVPFTIQVTDAAGASATLAYAVSIDPVPAITTATLPNWTVSQAYFQILTTTGGTGAITFTVSAGALPTGLSLNSSTGAIAGTPSSTIGSPFGFTLTAADAVGASVSQAYTVAINPAPGIPATTLPTGQVSQAYTTSIGVSGGTGPDTWTVPAGSLPAGLSLNTSTGALSGTPTTPTFTTLASFDPEPEGPQSPVLEDAAGNLFGTTPYGGSFTDGTVYEIAAGTHNLSTLFSFNGTDGSAPYGGLVEDASGNLYGTTAGGGASKDGTVFEISAVTHILTTLVTFTGFGNGQEPYAGLVMDSSGDLFGITELGGSANEGTVFELAAGTHAMTTLVNFTGSNNTGYKPEANLIVDSSGNLFGTTYYGGSSNDGTVFELTASTHNLLTLASFSGTNGQYPTAPVMEDSSGNLYGTTFNGGTYGLGTVFEVAAGSNTVTTLVSFNGSNGRNPNSSIVEDASGNLYGTTTTGSGSVLYGTVFEVAAVTHTLTTLVTFNGNDGNSPYAGLIEDASGNLFGTTASGYGTVFEVAAGTHALTTLTSFNTSDGATPEGGVIEDSSGNLFGTTSTGGIYNFGTVYEIAAGTDQMTTLVNFNFTDGAYPMGSLVEDASGDLFGTTLGGNGDTYGSVFEVTAGTDTLTTLVSFSNSGMGVDPQELLLDASGDLFGTTSSGGSGSYGTVFEIPATTRTLTILADFNTNTGSSPNPGLVEDSSGNLFGTTNGGGSSSDGTVYEVAAGTHTLTTLANFTSTTGTAPYGGLVEDNSGDFFGTTESGGSSNDGTVFEMAAGTHTLTTLVNFNGTNGATPYATGSLVEDAKGNLFGTTQSGGSANDGTVFELTAGKYNLITLYNFNGTDGLNPVAGLIEDSSGNLYGTAEYGGGYSGGSVFKVASGTFTIQATDAAGARASQTYPLTIYPTPTITTNTLPGWTVNQPYNQSVVVTSGTQPITFAVTAGSLPTGLILNSITGAITGTPTTTTGSPFSFTITATDINGATASAGYSVAISGPPTITTTTLPNWTVNQAYSQIITISGGTSPDSFALTLGSMPPGLTLNSSSGVITGTPTTTTGSPFGFTITATDSTGAAVSEAYTVGIDATPTLTPTTLQSGILNQPYSQTLSVSGGTAPVSYALSAGSLPAGLTLNSTTGVISGTPTNTTVTTLYSFLTEGEQPSGSLVEDASGNYYGATTVGGAANDGTVFEIAAATHALTTLVSFNGTNGSRPNGDLFVDSSGNLFGTTSAQGANGDGTVFEVAAGSQIITTLYSFTATTGSSAAGGLTEDSSGDLFGTTYQGGASNDGTVFEIAAGTHAFSTVVTFAGATNGAGPSGTLLVDGSGNVFGTTSAGGASNDGTVFEIAAGTHNLTTLVTFNGSNGQSPEVGLIEDASGNLFGTTYQGGVSKDGTVFEIAAGTWTFSTLANFSGSANGSNPDGRLFEDSSGDLFGTATYGGASGDGTVFEVANGTHALSTVATFTGANGINPSGGLVVDSNGDFLGTTLRGGSTGFGTVYEIAAGTNTITTVAVFSAGPNGANPASNLVEDSSGNLYGTTTDGGVANDGTVFEIAAGSSTLTTLVTFTGANGSDPQAGLVADSSGNLYGTTYGGGSVGDGTVFEIAAGTHTFTTVASFIGSNGENPEDSLIVDSNGDLFGTTYGSTVGNGTAFEIAAGTQTITTLSFFNTANIYLPAGSLVEDGSGNLFGVTYGGGAHNGGSVYEIAAGTHALTVLASFSSNSSPHSGLVMDASGNLYGTTYEGGTYGDGTVFEVTAGTHTLSTLVTFNGTDDNSPYGNLIEDSNGNLFGTTASGGTGDGTIFELTAGTHAFSILVTFTGGNGKGPESGLFENASGALFGTTSKGGAFGGGTVFEVPPDVFTIQATDAAGATASGTYTIPIAGLGITTTTLPAGTVSKSYAQTIAVSGGTSPITFAVTAGNLPTGVNLNTTTGAITGTPTSSSGSPFSFTITATDFTSATASQSYTVVINPAPTITTTTLPNWTVNQAYSQTITVSGGTSPDSFAVTSGSLPTGLSLNSGTGAITGTPTTITTSGSFTITVTDAAGATTSKNYELVISADPSLSNMPLATGVVNQAYTSTVSTTGGTGPITYSVTSGVCLLACASTVAPAPSLELQPPVRSILWFPSTA